MSKTIAIPYDVYESEKHILCIIPMGGVEKSSISIKLRDYALHIGATRNIPTIDDGFIRLQQECYRGSINCLIELPTQINYNDIESTLSPENILSITIPKKEKPAETSIPITIE